MTRVLLAEDDTSISEPLSRALRREGYQVEITEDGPATLFQLVEEERQRDDPARPAPGGDWDGRPMPRSPLN